MWANKPKNQARREMVVDHCTKNRHGLVNELHSIDFREDKDVRF
jgi:hypothetical protein